MRKYGTPTVMSAWCTSRMKEEVHDKYCDDKYGKGNYVTWLGIREDEPRRLKIGKNPAIRYMAEISDFDKQDVLDYWRKMPFNLEIEEHAGNCVFCIKKGFGKLALAAMENPELLDEFNLAIDLANDRLCKPRNITDDDGQVIEVIDAVKGAMFRKHKTMTDIINDFDGVDHGHLKQFTYRNIKDSGGCSESCEAFG